MKLNIVFLKAKKDLSTRNIRLLREIIQKHARKAGGLLGINLLNITVHPTKNVIAETGELGHATGSDWIRIGIDPTRKQRALQRIISDIIPATIYHEAHHISRKKYYGKSSTLFDAVISEGLADVFAKEKWLKFRAPWLNELKDIKLFLRELKKHGNNNKYSHSEWFFGSGRKPKWLGYKLGNYIVHLAKEKTPKLNALKMAKFPTKTIIKLSGV